MKRAEALTTLLHDAPIEQMPHPLVLLDIDALSTGSVDLETRWEDSHFRAARAEFLQILVAAARRGGWRLLRPAPIDTVSELLHDSGILLREAPTPPVEAEEDAGGRLLPRVQPASARLLSWLLAHEILTPTAAQDLFEAVATKEELSSHLTFLVYDSLRPSVRRVATHLATLRPPQLLNGHYGPFSIGPRSQFDTNISRDSLSILIDCGLVQPFASNENFYYMPRGVRHSLASAAETLGDPGVQQQHLRLARQPLDPTDIEGSIEVHHHAIQAEDALRAVETALFYVSDLRRLAVTLSLQGRWLDAAEVFRAIVEVDEGDAYAWEYLAYNLARAGSHIGNPDRAEEILKAYQRAATLEPHNPLFAGRLMGFRAELNQEILPEFGRQLAHFYQSYGDHGVSYFTYAVIKGLKRAERSNDLDALRSHWKSILFRSAKVSTLLDE